MKKNSLLIHGGISIDEKTGAVNIPIYQTSTYKQRSFGENSGYEYSRTGNPTRESLEKLIADIEYGKRGFAFASGLAAITAVLSLFKSGDKLLITNNLYGGTFRVIDKIFSNFGIGYEIIDDFTNIKEKIDDSVKAIYIETPTNPLLDVVDIKIASDKAKKYNLLTIVDNTFMTPYFQNPLNLGADIVIHSTTKYMDGHAVQVGGVIVDSGNFDWTNGKFPEFTEPDESYHGVVYTEIFGKAAYITKARVQLMRDLGCYPSAQNAFLLNLGLETLPVRIERHCKNAEKIAEFLSSSDKVEFVNYPTLKENKYYHLASKYLPKGCSGVISFSIKGGREEAVKFMDSLNLASNVVHVADIRTCVLHPASSTHRQLTDEQLVAAGITPGLVRLSVGLENVEDIIDDLKQALLK